jgi:hypothetical protein
MSAVILAAGIGALCGLAAWAAVSLIEQADAEQGPPPTLRPHDPGFDDGLDVDGLPLLDAAELLCVDHPDAIIWKRGERR